MPYTPPPASPPHGPPPLPSLPQLLGDLLDELPGVVGDRVHLLTLELRRATQALSGILVLGLAAALLGITAWLALWIGMAAAAIAWGLHWGWVAAGVVALNLLLAALAVQRLRALVPLMGLPATVRRLTQRPEEPADTAAPQGDTP